MNLNNIHEYIKKTFDLKRISVEFRLEKSYNGYPLDICKSALQKYIRRGEVDKAIYIANEIFLFTLIEDSVNKKRILTNFIHRLQIIFLEEIGLTCYNIWNKIDEYIDILIKRTENNEKILETFVNLVYTMAKNNHSRSLDHYNSLRIIYSKKEEISDYLEYFTEIEKYYRLVDNKYANDTYFNYIESVNKKETDVGFWVRELEDEGKLKINTLKKIFKPLQDIKFNNIGLKWTKELNGLKERYLCYYNVITYNLFEKEVEIPEGKIYTLSMEEIFEKIKVNLNKKLEIDSYVIDMHTKLGRSRGSNIKNFIYEGSIVSAEWLVNKEWSDYYNFINLYFKADIIDENFLK